MKTQIISALILITAGSGFLIRFWGLGNEHSDIAIPASLTTAAEAGNQILNEDQLLAQIPSLPDAIDFSSQVAPIFRQHCLKCHSQDNSESGLILSSRPSNWPFAMASWKHSGGSREGVLYKRLTADDPKFRMPPDTQLNNEQLDILKQWIDEGAYWPQQSPLLASELPESEQDHWAYRKFAETTVKKVQCDAWPRNFIDNFILARLEQSQITPAPELPRHKLIRKLVLAITGLPPTADQYQRYSDTSEDTLDLLVHELINSHTYGEHWASRWLDLVRYADTNGYEDDGRKPLAWKFRNFVIQAFNEDLPYDEFVRKQIAGDKQQDAQEDDYVAAGFLRLGPWDSEPGNKLVSRYDQLNEIVSTTTTVFLGMSLECARCHDHPEEPLTISDYYRFQGLFESLIRPVSGRQEETSLSANRNQLLKASQAHLEKRQLIQAAFASDDPIKAKELRAQAKKLLSNTQFDSAYRFYDSGLAPTETRVLRRGDPLHPGESLSPGVPAILNDGGWETDKPSRLELANWLIEDKKALTARLIVNRIWEWHFGRGLVESSSNFGLSGESPSYPELLDHLARWFVEEAGWSLKELHRLILKSRTYRLGPSASDISFNHQQLNLWGASSRRRLTAEEVHDGMLSIAGLLSDEMYGPPKESMLASSTSDSNETPKQTDTTKRAIYSIVKRNSPHQALRAFNLPDRMQSCAKRSTTHDTHQAFHLWNGELSKQCANSVAKRILKDENLNGSNQIEQLYQLVLGRRPTTQELKMCQDYMDFVAREGEPERSEQSTLSDLCLILFNSNEFLFVD